MSSILVEVALANINFKDPDIKQYEPVINTILDLVAKETNTDRKQLEDYFYLKYNKYKNNPGISFPIRQAAFGLLELLPPNKIPVEIDLKEISELYTNIKVYLKMFRNLRDIFTGRVYRPTVIFVPNPLLKDKSYNSIKTGAASPKGDLIFNLDFIKRLVYIAELELKHNIVKIKSKMFESQGGIIPDKYVYITFLIIHELFHLVQSDVSYLDKQLIKYICKNKNKYKFLKNIPSKDCENNIQIKRVANEVQNIVADYFNNYNITRLGLPALPIGLFSNEINLEKMTYEEAYDRVLKEFDNMTEEQRKQMQNQTDEHIDANENIRNPKDNQQQGQQQNNQQNNQQGQSGEEGEQSQQGQNNNQQQGQQGDNQQNNQQQGNQKTQQGQQQGNQGKQGNQQGDTIQKQGGQGSGNDINKIPEKNVSGELDKKRNEINKEVEETAKETITKKISKDEIEKEKEKIRQKESEKLDSKKIQEITDKLKQANSENTQIDFANIKPRYKWSELLKKMKPSGEKEEETYTKQSRKSSARLLQAKQTGKTAIKPGTKIEEGEERSVMFVLDRSGSMSDVFGKINTEMKQLITKKMSRYFDNFYLIKFDNKFSFYVISIEENKIYEIPNILTEIKKMKNKWNPQVFEKAKKRPYPLKHFFDTSDWAGGTDFSKELKHIVELFLKNEKNNAVIISDTDLLWRDNKRRISSLILKFGKKPFKFNIILNDRESYIEWIKEFRGYRYLSYILED